MDKIATKEALSAVAQALSDRIAQRDYIFIDVQIIPDDYPLRKYIENGTIFSVVFRARKDSPLDDLELELCPIIAVDLPSECVYTLASGNIKAIGISDIG